MRNFRFAAHLVQIHGAPASSCGRDSLRPVSPAVSYTDDNLSAARGVIYGCFGGLACWAVIGAIVQIVRMFL